MVEHLQATETHRLGRLELSDIYYLFILFFCNLYSKGSKIYQTLTPYNKNTRPHTLGCNTCKVLNICVNCGAGVCEYPFKPFKYNYLPFFINSGVRFGKFRSQCNILCISFMHVTQIKSNYIFLICKNATIL